MGTPVPLTLYTNLNCDTPSTLNPNASLDIGVCAVTPGLESVHVPSVSCSSGIVQVWAFSDVTCVETEDIFFVGDGCYGAAIPGAYAAILLNCDEQSPGTATSTTTISVGPIATGGAQASASSVPGSSSSGGGGGGGGSSPSSSTASGWDALSTGSKVGIIAGCLAALCIFLIICKFIDRRKTPIVNGRYQPHTGGAKMQDAETQYPAGPPPYSRYSPYSPYAVHTPPFPTPPAPPPQVHGNHYVNPVATDRANMHNGNNTNNTNNYYFGRRTSI